VVMGYCIMPDHLHWLVGLLPGTDLSGMCRQFASFTASACNRAAGRDEPFWQHGFYDHILRGREAYERHLRYVHENPVRRKLVASPQEWPCSTAHPDLASDIEAGWL
jgi:putative transposase